MNIKDLEMFLKNNDVHIVFNKYCNVNKFMVVEEDGDCGFDPALWGDTIEEAISKTEHIWKIDRAGIVPVR